MTDCSTILNLNVSLGGSSYCLRVERASTEGNGELVTAKADLVLCGGKVFLGLGLVFTESVAIRGVAFHVHSQRPVV